MRSITIRLIGVWPLRRICYRIMVIVCLIAGISSTLVAAPTLGPADGDGLIPTDLERIKVGDSAPDFTLEGENGTPITLSQFREKKAVILVFYRGHW